MSCYYKNRDKLFTYIEARTSICAKPLFHAALVRGSQSATPVVSDTQALREIGALAYVKGWNIWQHRTPDANGLPSFSNGERNGWLALHHALTLHDPEWHQGHQVGVQMLVSAEAPDWIRRFNALRFMSHASDPYALLDNPTLARETLSHHRHAVEAAQAGWRADALAHATRFSDMTAALVVRGQTSAERAEMGLRHLSNALKIDRDTIERVATDTLSMGHRDITDASNYITRHAGARWGVMVTSGIPERLVELQRALPKNPTVADVARLANVPHDRFFVINGQEARPNAPFPTALFAFDEFVIGDTVYRVEPNGTLETTPLFRVFCDSMKDALMSFVLAHPHDLTEAALSNPVFHCQLAKAAYQTYTEGVWVANSSNGRELLITDAHRADVLDGTGFTVRVLTSDEFAAWSWETYQDPHRRKQFLENSLHPALPDYFPTVPHIEELLEATATIEGTPEDDRIAVMVNALRLYGELEPPPDDPSDHWGIYQRVMEAEHHSGLITSDYMPTPWLYELEDYVRTHGVERAFGKAFADFVAQ